MLIYSKNISKRLEYAIELVLKPWYPEAQITNDSTQCKNFAGPVIWYDAEKNPDATLWIEPCGLLDQQTIEKLNPKCGDWHGIPTLFPVSADIPFDLFAASFYLATRYEEYGQEDGRDDMGRFLASSSVAFKNGFLHRPIIDEWRNELARLIESSHPGSTQFSEFKELLSVDVDSAFAYKNKGFKRTLGGFALDMIKLRFGNFFRRLAAVLGMRKDDFDTYDHILQSTDIPVIWFFLLADYNSYDINVPHTSEALRKLITKLDGKGQVGIHPGVKSNEDIARLKKEIGRLVEITRRPCLHSRQHYLVLRYPETYRNLLSSGIRHDYTMGYADLPGFRASTSFAHRWYDLSKEEITSLYVHPFAYMDTTFRQYLNLSVDETELKIEELRSAVRTTKGVFISLWHNESFSNLGKWKNWSVRPTSINKTQKG